MAAFSGEQVHRHLYQVGLRNVIVDCPELNGSEEILHLEGEKNGEFHLWKIIKAQAIARLQRLHSLLRYGDLIGSKVKLPTDRSKPMELDLLGVHESGLFVLELKVDRSAERNAFSELFAYSNYIAGIFALSGSRDITNVLVANVENNITRQAFLYDLIVNERDILIYIPVFESASLSSLQLKLYLPSDDDFRQFANHLLSHDSIECVVISFHDLPGWFDSEEEDRSLNEWTREHLAGLSGYAAQLMESERLHGFCFIRKPWKEIDRYYRNSLFICAVNPFRFAEPDRTSAFLGQFDEQEYANFFELPEAGFKGRLIRLARRAVNESFTHDHKGEVETPCWSGIITSIQEVVTTHNFAFRPTGMMREAYVSHLNGLYARRAAGKGLELDISVLKINEINDWLSAWTFMERCGFKAGSPVGATETDE